MIGRISRRLLIVASQCRNMPDLPFLPAKDHVTQLSGSLSESRNLVLRLYDQLTSNGGGHCEPVRTPESIGHRLLRPGLLVNPSVAEADAALLSALESSENSVLVIYYIGHAKAYERPGKGLKHYLQVIDAAEDPAGPGEGWNPYSAIGDRIQQLERRTAGIVMLVDACQSSAATQAVVDWAGPDARLCTLWIGSSALNLAYNGCFTSTLTTLIKEGIDRETHPTKALVSQLTASDVVALIKNRCQREPVVSGFQYHDPAMFLALNRAAEDMRVSLGLDAQAAETIAGLVRWYVPHGLDVVRQSLGHRLTWIVGEPGTGKTTLAAAMRMPPADTDIAEVDAVAFLARTSSVDTIAATLHRQLLTIPRFARACEADERKHRQDPAKRSAVERWLLGPLARIQHEIVIAIDGEHELDATGREAVHDLVRALTSASLPSVRVLVTSQRSPGGSLAAHVVELSRPELDTVTSYLQKRGIAIPEGPSPGLTNIDWHHAVKMVDLLAQSEGGDLGGDLSHVFEPMRTAAEPSARNFSEFRSALTVLAATFGTGAIMPFRIFQRAVSLLADGAGEHLYRLLATPDMQALIRRTGAGGRDERLGPADQTVTTWLSSRTDVQSGHAAIYRAIRERAQVEPGLSDDSYAFSAEAEHAWNGGSRRDVIEILERRRSLVPRRNLEIWTSWLPRIEREWGAEDAHTFQAKLNHAYWTGIATSAREAERLCKAILREQRRLGSRRDAAVLTTLSRLARWRGQAAQERGDSHALRRALQMLKAIHAAQLRVLPGNDREVLRTRANIAQATGALGSPDDARREFEQVLSLQLQDPTLARDAWLTRFNIAYWAGRSGAIDDARRVAESLLEELTAHGERDSQLGLKLRVNLAELEPSPHVRRQQLTVLRAIQSELLGAMHPDSLRTASLLG